MVLTTTMSRLNHDIQGKCRNSPHSCPPYHVHITIRLRFCYEHFSSWSCKCHLKQYNINIFIQLQNLNDQASVLLVSAKKEGIIDDQGPVFALNQQLKKKSTICQTMSDLWKSYKVRNSFCLQLFLRYRQSCPMNYSVELSP